MPALKSSLSLKPSSVPLQVAVLRSEERRRADEQSDAIFYSVPRFVQYVDETFRQQVKGWYGRHLREGDEVLDLCASYESHLPEVELKSVMGHGMCGPELAANSALDSYLVKDLNEDPAMDSMPSESYDCVLCCMGLQYLKYPEDVCIEIRRILKPRGKFLISFTSHCFPEKTITGWLERTLAERSDLVKRLLWNAGFVDVCGVASVPAPDCPNVVSDSVSDCQIDLDVRSSFDYPDNDINGLTPEHGSPAAADPFYGVVGTKSWTDVDASASSGERIMDFAPPHLDVLDELDLSCEGTRPPYARYRRAMQAYSSLCDWAVALGIPRSAVPFPSELDSIESLKEKRNYLRGMIASFVSSGL